MDEQRYSPWRARLGPTGKDSVPASDWVKIEQQRGISVFTSVQWYIIFNLPDIPGHKDFNEDT